MSETVKSLDEKILEIMKDVQYIKKDDKVQFGKTAYSALSEEKITMLMREKLIEQRITVKPIAMDYNRTGNIASVQVTYRMTNVDDPKDYYDICSCGEGADTQDKAAGKAMTYAYKYMWLRTFAIPTGDDPDKICSDQLDAQFAKQAKTTARVFCDNCGQEIHSIFRKDGLEIKPADAKAQLFGVCVDCYRARYKAQRKQGGKENVKSCNFNGAVNP